MSNLGKRLANDLTEAIYDVWQGLEANGKGLFEWAMEDPGRFYGMFLKAVLPKQVTVDGEVLHNHRELPPAVRDILVDVYGEKKEMRSIPAIVVGEPMKPELSKPLPMTDLVLAEARHEREAYFKHAEKERRIAANDA